MLDATQLRLPSLEMSKTHRSLRKQKKGLHDMSRAKKKRVRVRHGQRSGLQRTCFNIPGRGGTPNIFMLQFFWRSTRKIQQEIPQDIHFAKMCAAQKSSLLFKTVFYTQLCSWLATQSVKAPVNDRFFVSISDQLVEHLDHFPKVRDEHKTIFETTTYLVEIYYRSLTEFKPISGPGFPYNHHLG